MGNTTIKIDQFTLILKSTEIKELEDIRDWKYTAESMIAEFIRLSSLNKLFEIKPQETMFPTGYTTGYTLADVPYYLSIPYHPSHPVMGVIVKFSAQAWAAYQEYTLSKFHQNIQLYHFLSEIESELYTYHLSRIDIAVDFFDEDINLQQLRKSLETNRTELRYGKYKKRRKNAITNRNR